MTVNIVCADAREALAAMPEGSVHTCITSPPYWGLRDYGLEPVVWGGDDHEHEWGEPILGQSQSGSLEGSTLDGAPPGQERRPEWSSAFCRRCNAWRGSLGLEPSPELYVEHIVQVMREVRRVLRDDGTLWLNLGDSYGSGTRASRDYSRNVKHGYWQNPAIDKRIPAPAKQLLGMPWRVAFALQADGWWLRSEITWCKGSPMPESVRDRPTSATEKVFLLTKSATYYYDQNAVRVPTSGNHKGSYFDAGKTAGHQLGRASTEPREEHAGRNLWNWWLINPQPYPGAHFATFPEKLVEPCILAGCPPTVCAMCYNPVYGEGFTRPPADRTGLPRVRDALQGSGPEVLQSGVLAEGVEQEPPQVTEALRSMRSADGGAQATLLQPEVLGSLEDSERHGPATTGKPRDELELARRQGESRRAHHGAEAGAPDGDEGGIRRGASPSDGGGSRASADNAGVCSSPKRNQDGQQAGEPRNTRQQSPSRHRTLPTLRGRVQHPVSRCCGAPLVPGKVLDPFAGSGTVGLVAERLGRHSVLIDASEDYCQMARERTAQMGLMV